jgi:hypothetical protein
MSAWEVQATSRGTSEAIASPTTSLLKLVRAQKQVQRRIDNDPVFQQYSMEIRQRENNLRRRGWKSEERPQIDEDLRAEAHSRLMSLIAMAAKARDHEARGVFTRFGKPYRPLGEVAEVC